MSRSGWIRAWKCRPVGRSFSSSSAATSMHPVAELRFQAGGFRVEQDGAAHCKDLPDQPAQCLQRRMARQARCGSRRPRGVASPRRASGARSLPRCRRRSFAGGRGCGASAPARGAETTTMRSTALIAAGLQQQRDVEHHCTSALPPGARDEGTLLLPHHRVQDRLQPGQRIRLAQHRLTQCHAVHLAVAHRARETPPRSRSPPGRHAPAICAPRHRRRIPGCAPGGTPRRPSTSPCRCRRSGRG